MVGVVAYLGGQVEGHGESRLALFQQIPVASIGLLCRGVAGVLAHGPEPAPVHGGLNAAGKGVLPGVAQVLLMVEAAAAKIIGVVDRVHVQPRLGGEGVASLRLGLQSRA